MPKDFNATRSNFNLLILLLNVHFAIKFYKSASLNTWRVCNSASLTSVTDLHCDMLNDLNATQLELHAWSRANQIVFNPSNKSLHILHIRFPNAEDLKILGCVLNTKLLCIRRIA